MPRCFEWSLTHCLVCNSLSKGFHYNGKTATVYTDFATKILAVYFELNKKSSRGILNLFYVAPILRLGLSMLNVKE